MPIYEYVCQTCDGHFEKRQKFSDDPVAECPTCGSEETRRLIAAPAIVFKGSGFYINDSRGANNGHIDSGGKTKEKKKTETTKSEESK